ncbi:MAG: hypothetical protein V2I43_10285, partial [Parvularcula sp.]|nr:hypothetical protein [Parvularcula sp.]
MMTRYWLLAMPLLAACAYGTKADTQRDLSLAEDPRVGASIVRACFTGQINAFSDWSGGDGMILRRGTNDDVLVTFVGSCVSAERALAIALPQSR